ncbi:hypothetical protein GCM10027298_13440 [Epidermidibacterium keratini]
MTLRPRAIPLRAYSVLSRMICSALAYMGIDMGDSLSLLEDLRGRGGRSIHGHLAAVRGLDSRSVASAPSLLDHR